MTPRTWHRPKNPVVQGGVLLAVGFLTAAPSAQSLGEVAAKEARRRQQVTAGKRYTAEDLAPDSGSAPPTAQPAAQQEQPRAPVPGETSATQASDGDTPPPKERRDESYWRARAKEIRAKIEQLHARLKALDGRVADLDSQIEQGAGGAASSERDVSERALANARRDAESMQGEWDRFEARARSMNVPPDWIR